MSNSGRQFFTFDGSEVTNGEGLYPRRYISAEGVNTVSGTLYLAYFMAKKNGLVSSITHWTGTTGAAATPTLCRLGFYQENSDGSLALIGSTTNDTTLFANSNAAYTENLTTPVNKVAGQRYAVGTLVVSGTTMPTFEGIAPAGSGGTGLALINQVSPRLATAVAGLSDLPASVTTGQVTTLSIQQIYAEVR